VFDACNERRAMRQIAPRLGWDEGEIERQLAEYANQVALTRRWRAGQTWRPPPF
jgi:Spy/CpxP family protein refolding chaperone